VDDKMRYTFDNVRREPYFLLEDGCVILCCSHPALTRTRPICRSNEFINLEQRTRLKQRASGFLDIYVKAGS
jgi:hypothetical protein